jgi:hypothetical protein
VRNAASAGNRNGTVKCQQLVDSRVNQKRLEFACAHRRRVEQHTMVLDEPAHASHFEVRQPQPFRDGLRRCGAHGVQ